MKYDELDAAILQAIKSGRQQFFIIDETVRELAIPHSLLDSSFRVVDRRLQSLRKRGLVKFLRKEWVAI
jgi:hypothetical protein